MLADLQATGGDAIAAENFRVLRSWKGREMLRIASRNDLTQAKQLVQSLNACWPATYIVRFRKSGKDVAREGSSEDLFNNSDPDH